MGNVRLFILLLLLLPSVASGQKYKYQYRQQLIRQQSTHNTETTDLFNSDKGRLIFQILDQKGVAIPFVNIVIKNKDVDTTIQSDLNGFATINLVGTFSFFLFDLQFTPINIENFILKENTETTLKVSLGLANLRIAHIYSIRKLKDNEIQKLVEDLSNDADNELINNKTCYVTWEI